MTDEVRNKLSKMDPTFCFHHNWCKPCNPCMHNIVFSIACEVKKSLEHEHRITYRKKLVKKANADITKRLNDHYHECWEFESMEFGDYIDLDKITNLPQELLETLNYGGINDV